MRFAAPRHQRHADRMPRIARAGLVLAVVVAALLAAVLPVAAAPRDDAPAPPRWIGETGGAGIGADLRAASWTLTPPRTTREDATLDGSSRDLTSVSIQQSELDVIVGWRMVRRHALASFTADAPLCVRIGWTNTWRRQACVDQGGAARPLRVSSLLTAPASITRRPAARIWHSADLRTVYVRFPIAALAAPSIDWNVQWSVRNPTTGPCTVPNRCLDTAPEGVSVAHMRPRIAQPAFCTAQAPWSPRHTGITSGKMVSLTFDDGPGPYTHRVLDELRRLHATATFFSLGQSVRDNPSLARREFQEHEIASHSWQHLMTPSLGDQRRTLDTIEDVTGYRPCLFRPPYGALSGAMLDAARTLRTDTIIWDVDPQDWRVPSTSSIVGNVTGHAHPGAIILLHDAGGPRGNTVAAIDPIVTTLRRRGFRFVPLTELLGLRTTWKYHV